MSDTMGEVNAPLNMRRAYLQLQQIYGEEGTPLVLGTEMHGGKTDMVQIEVGKDQMMLCLIDNYHRVPEKYRDSSPFFVLGHEFGHIVAHPGKDSKYWIEGMKAIPVEAYQKGRWLNCISDILVNWTVITGTKVKEDVQLESIKQQMLDGWQASQFVRRCNTKEGFAKHKSLLKNSVKGVPLKDNRYQPKGGLVGQYDDAEPGNKYQPTANTPFYQKYMGHGRGEQYYPPINYCVAEKMEKNWRKTLCIKNKSKFKEGKKYIVEGTKTYYGRENTKQFEPIAEYYIDGEWVSARYFQDCCPQCESKAISIWGYWWAYKSESEKLAEIESEGTWRYLLIQMFAFEWAMAYSSRLKMGKKPLKRETGEYFLDLISHDMDKVMRGG